MGVEHFSAGASEGNGGIIQPIAGSPEQINRSQERLQTAVAKRGRSVGTKYVKPSDDGSAVHVVAEETIEEGRAPAPRAARQAATPRASVRRSTLPTGARGAIADGEKRPKTSDALKAIEEMHSSYTGLVNSAKGIKKLGDTERAYVSAAESHLVDAKSSLALARSQGGLGTSNMNNDVAHGHLQDAAHSVASAHEMFVAGNLHNILAEHKMISKVATDVNVRDMGRKAYALERRGAKGVAGATVPFKKVELAGKTFEGKTIADSNLEDKARETFGANSPITRKVRNAKGTRRGVNAGLTMDNPENPKRKASPTKRIDTGYRSQANDIGRTPRWGE